MKKSTDYLSDIPTVKEYKAALLAVRHVMTEKQLEMLRAHYHSPKHTITATKMAETVGYPSYSTVNLQYGIFGRRLCEQLSRSLEFQIAILADFGGDDTSASEIRWIMLPQVAKALSDLKWV